MARLPLFFAAAGTALFALALWRASLTTPAADEPRALARLERSFGSVVIERAGRRWNVDKREAFHRFDAVETGPASEATLTLPTGEEVRVLENSLIFAELERGRTVLIVKNGDVWAERPVEEAKSVLVSRDGLRRPLAADTRIDRRGKRPARKIAKAVPAAPVRARGETLSAEMIQETLRTQRNLFFKCYGQLLQRTPGVSGEASLAFTIERTGRVTLAEVASSSLQDGPFRRCLTDAVKRIEFKSFAGDPVQTLFPLRFE